MRRISQYVPVICECGEANRPGAIQCEFCHEMLEPFRLEDVQPEDLQTGYSLDD